MIAKGRLDGADGSRKMAGLVLQPEQIQLAPPSPARPPWLLRMPTSTRAASSMPRNCMSARSAWRSSTDSRLALAACWMPIRSCTDCRRNAPCIGCRAGSAVCPFDAGSPRGSLASPAGHAELAAGCCRSYPSLPGCGIARRLYHGRCGLRAGACAPGRVRRQDAKACWSCPWLAGQELLALLFVTGSGDRHFASAEMELGRTIANQASIALQNARLYQSTVRTRRAAYDPQPIQRRDRHQP